MSDNCATIWPKECTGRPRGGLGDKGELATNLEPAVGAAWIVLRTVTISARSASCRSASAPSGTSARAVGDGCVTAEGKRAASGGEEEEDAAGCGAGAGCGRCCCWWWVRLVKGVRDRLWSRAGEATSGLACCMVCLQEGLR